MGKRGSWSQAELDAYNRELQALDEMVDNSMRSLTATGEAENTLAILISDNGGRRGNHGLAGKHGRTRTRSECRSTRRWPGHVPTGAHRGDIAANIDLAPTIYEATRTAPPGYVPDGRSLLRRTGRKYVLTEFLGSTPASDASAQIWSPTRAYIRWPADDFVEDYNLRTDPYELAARNVPDPAIQAALDAALACAGPACP